MSIKTPRQEIENLSNNNFHAEIVVSTASYGICDTSDSQDVRTNFETSYGVPFYTGMLELPQFEIPTNDNPMKASEFLSWLNLRDVIEIMDGRYGEHDYHFKYPPDAMIKALVFKHIKGIKSDSALVRHLKKYPEDAKSLGFVEVKGQLKIPSQQTFSHFITSRMRNEGLYDLFDLLVLTIKDGLRYLGYELGKTLSIDSTPLASQKKDPDAEYNPHYRVKGYKIHNVIDADLYIPLAFNFTPITNNDSPHYLPLLERVKMMDIDFDKVLADGAYASFENFAIVNQHYRARTVFNMREDAKFSDKGTDKGIKKHYNLLWKEEGFKPDAGRDYMLSFLLWHHKYEVVGAYYRNQHLKEWESKAVETKLEYNKRAGVEAFHGHIKQQMGIEKHLNKNGLRGVEQHVLIVYISLLCLALCRVQNGVRSDLVNVKCLV